MATVCENCGQSVLGTDETCWHCGWRLPRNVVTAPAASGRDPTSRESDDISFLAVTAYALLSLIIFLVALLVMRTLGRQTLDLQPNNAGNARPVTVTSKLGEYAITLPFDWIWLERANTQHLAEFEQLVSANDQFQSVMAPLGDPRSELLLAAIAIEPQEIAGIHPVFVFIAFDVRPEPISAERSIAMVRQNRDELEVLEAKLTFDHAGRDVGSFMLDIPHGRHTYRCMQRYVESDPTHFLVGACSLNTFFPPHATQLGDAAESFLVLAGPGTP